MTDPTRLAAAAVRIARRTALGSAAAALLTRPPAPQLVGRITLGHKELPSPNTVWEAHAATSTRAVLLMRSLPRNWVAVRDGAATVTSTTVRSQAARLTVPVMASGTRSVRVEGLDFSLPVTVSTTPAALLASEWVLVNKRNSLPAGFVPPGLVSIDGVLLRSSVAQAYSQLRSAAASAGVSLRLNSGYRSYAAQATLYDQDAARYGRAYADQHTARAGYSEHQTGLALDLAITAGTSAANWVAANAHRFGFVVRYESGQQSVTGYMYEPWHLRYLGIVLAAQYRAWGMHSLEAVLDFPAAPTY